MLTQHDTQIPLSPTGRRPGLLGLWSQITQPWKEIPGQQKASVHSRGALNGEGPAPATPRGARVTGGGPGDSALVRRVHGGRSRGLPSAEWVNQRLSCSSKFLGPCHAFTGPSRPPFSPLSKVHGSRFQFSGRGCWPNSALVCVSEGTPNLD